ncbi:MAG: nucleotide sugar dehydrogenase [Proteobacteria bacterium]|nr:nucleotide sugar dehydrogenase [Pseudomonadota bacterium]
MESKSSPYQTGIATTNSAAVRLQSVVDTGSVQSLDLDLTRANIAVIGLGYVGLPLATAFGRRFPTTGFDIDPRRVMELQGGHDRTREVTREELDESNRLRYASGVSDIAECNVYVVSVPTPVDRYKRPDLRPLESASTTVGRVLSKGAVVVFESTVYPGATEEVCSPIIEDHSGLRVNEDFYLGYSPERINPGDRAHRLEDIVKVTSGSTPEAAEFIDALYGSVITAGTHRTETIREAEAAKVIENTQRDVNIALVNELATLFNRLGIDTNNVLKAAGSKWNFLPFRPGLVGGHCIGVDPYYLTHKAREVGFLPEIILSGRRTNDEMGQFIAGRVVKLLTQRRIHVVGSRILVLGLSFKENCPDVRNTRVTDILQEFSHYHAHVDVHDPWVHPDDAARLPDVHLVEKPDPGVYDAIILAVAHREFVAMSRDDMLGLCKPRHVIYDVRGVLPRDIVTERL